MSGAVRHSEVREESNEGARVVAKPAEGLEDERDEGCSLGGAGGVVASAFASLHVGSSSEWVLGGDREVRGAGGVDDCYVDVESGGSEHDVYVGPSVVGAGLVIGVVAGFNVNPGGTSGSACEVGEDLNEGVVASDCGAA